MDYLELKELNDFLWLFQKGYLRKEFKINIHFNYGENNRGLAAYNTKHHHIVFHPFNVYNEYYAFTYETNDFSYNLSYDEFGCYVLFHELGHSKDVYRKSYEQKQKSAIANKNYGLFCNLEILSEFNAYVLGKQILNEFLLSDYYQSFPNKIDLEVEKEFYDYYNLLNLKNIVKELNTDYPTLKKSTWFNNVKDIINEKKSEEVVTQLPQFINFGIKNFS
ncbi:hypothetical protein [Bacillus toyonensis]|uniref:hypothetical protein n=1 Tax=Bacillus toyonensis TaxID=155322 RepID=UPI000BF72FEA|nr:hypothetical protein [Bacillus toyonensis]PFY80045.1 hypothetical protein COL59_28505 [Bacillus toyonensis]